MEDGACCDRVSLRFGAVGSGVDKNITYCHEIAHF